MTEVREAPVRIDEVTGGTLLRRAREATGLHVAALAVSLKVPVRKLEALEADRYQDVGDPVFVRGLASSVCRSLKVDPRPILERLPQAAATRLVPDTDALNTPFRAPSDALPETWLDRLRQPVPATVIGLLLAAVVIYFVPIEYFENKPAQAVVVSAPQAAPAPALPAEPAPAAAAAATPIELTPASPQSQVAAAMPQATASAVPVVATMSPAAPVPGASVVVVRTKGESWVEVVDAKGSVAVRKLMVPGESVGAGGVLPLQVTIGKADQTEVEVRGSRYDLRPVSRDNVARFEIR